MALCDGLHFYADESYLLYIQDVFYWNTGIQTHDRIALLFDLQQCLIC